MRVIMASRAMRLVGATWCGLGELQYLFHGRDIAVTSRDRACRRNRKSNLSQVFARRNVGIKEGQRRNWLVTFMHRELGFFDQEARWLELVDSRFEPKVSPMSSVETATDVTGMDLKIVVASEGLEPPTKGL